MEISMTSQRLRIMPPIMKMKATSATNAQNCTGKVSGTLALLNPGEREHDTYQHDHPRERAPPVWADAEQVIQPEHTANCNHQTTHVASNVRVCLAYNIIFKKQYRILVL